MADCFGSYSSFWPKTTTYFNPLATRCRADVPHHVVCAKAVVPVHVTLTDMPHQISSRRTRSRRLSVSQRTHTRRLYVVWIIFLSNFKWGFILDQNLVIAISEKRRLKISSWHRFPTDSSRGKLKIEVLSHGKTVCCGHRRHRRE